MAKKKAEAEQLQVPSVKDEVKVVFMDTAQRTADFILRRYGIRIPIELHPKATFTNGLKIYVDQTLEKYDNQDVNELMKSKLIHEIGHVLFSSFAWTTEDIRKQLQKQVKVYPTYYNDRILADASGEKILSSYRQLCEDWFITKKLAEGYFGSSDMLNKSYVKAYPNIENAEQSFERMSWGQRFGWVLFYRLMADSFISHRDTYMHNFKYIIKTFTDTKLFWDHFFNKGYFNILQKANTSEQICDALFPFTDDVRRMFKQAEKKKQAEQKQNEKKDEDDQEKRDQLGKKDTEQKPLNENDFDEDDEEQDNGKPQEDEDGEDNPTGTQHEEDGDDEDTQPYNDSDTECEDNENEQDYDGEESGDDESEDGDEDYPKDARKDLDGVDDLDFDDEQEDDDFDWDENERENSSNYDDSSEHGNDDDWDDELPDDLEDSEDGGGVGKSGELGEGYDESDTPYEGENVDSGGDSDIADADPTQENIFDQLDLDNIKCEENNGVADEMDKDINKDKREYGGWRGPEKDFHAEPFIIQNDEIIYVADDPRYVTYMKDSEAIYRREIAPYINTIQKLLNTVYDRLFSKTDALRVASKTGKKYRSSELLKMGNFDDYISHLPKYNTISQEEKSIAVSILVDNSGSMSTDGKIETARVLTFILAEVFKNANVAFEITGFTTKRAPDPQRRRGYREEREFSPRFLCTINLVHKSFGSDNIYPLASMGRLGMQNNADGASVEYASMELMKRGEDRKLFFLLSDGEPSGYNQTEAGMEHIKYAREVIEENDIEFFSIGIQNNYMETLPEKSDYYYGKDKWINIATTKQTDLLVDLFDKITSKII